MTTLKRKPSHKIIDENNIEYDISIVQDYTESSDYAIIVNESATGDSATIYHNGRLQEDIPISGVLVGDSIADVVSKKDKLKKVADNRLIIEFISPFLTSLRSNKFYIKKISFNINAGRDRYLPFQITLAEYRNANIKTIAVNLINFQSREQFLDVYNSRIGNT